MLRTTLLLIAVVGLLGVDVSQALAIPSDDLLRSLRPSGDVNDYAGLLNETERGQLEARCRTLRERTGAQFAVVTLRSLQGGQIEDFGTKLFKLWGIGQKDKDNGLLLIVAMEERRSRVEVGYGLERIISDTLAARVLDQKLRPRFREQRFAAGLTDAVNELCDLVERGEPAPADTPDTGSLAAAILFLAMFVAIGGFLLGVGFGAKVLAVGLFGLVFGLIPFGLGAALAAPWAPLVHSVVGLAAGALGWAAGRGYDGRGRTRTSRRPWTSTNTDSWTWGSTWPSTDWSGGGFSQSWGGFGGGSSGGGGATSSW